MKRKVKGDTVDEQKTKKVKKSVNFSSNVEVTEIPNNVPKNQKLNKTTAGFKKQKKVKFEKQVVAKKSNKINEKDESEKPKKVNKIARMGSKQISNNSSTNEKPNWLEFKKKKKELKGKRKARKLTDIYDISVKAKQIGEKLRRSDCPAEEREKLTTELHTLLKGQCDKVILSHDMSRIVQWLLRYCNLEIRESIVTELKPLTISLFQSTYAKNCIKTALKYGSDQIRADILSSCYGNIVKLASHTVSAPILEYAFSSWATDLDKIYFKQEFYGDMYKQAKDNKVKTLTDVFQNANDMKPATLSAVKGNLLKILNKKLINSSLMQSVLLEFFVNCTSEDRGEMIVTLRDQITELSRTKDGAKVAMMCVWHGTNKDRKIIMKTLKGEVKDISMSEYGYMILLALIDSTDDTVIMTKIILTEVQNSLTEMALNEYGKRVILYLVARRDPHYFHPAVVEQLKQGDLNSVSKKPADIREKELLEAVIDKFLATVTAEMTTWLSNSSIAMVTLAILKVGSGENLKSAFKEIAKFITNSESKITENEVEHRAIEHSGLHMMMKKLIQNDENIAQKGETTFGEVLIDHLSANVIEQWIEFNRGCFLLITLIESGTQSVVAYLLSKLKLAVKSLKSKKSSGASILLKKIK